MGAEGNLEGAGKGKQFAQQIGPILTWNDIHPPNTNMQVYK